MDSDTPIPLSKESTQRLTPKEYIEHEEAMSNIALREHAASFLFKAYASLLAATVLIIFLQGFQLWGYLKHPGIDSGLAVSWRPPRGFLPKRGGRRQKRRGEV